MGACFASACTQRRHRQTHTCSALLALARGGSEGGWERGGGLRYPAPLRGMFVLHMIDSPTPTPNPNPPRTHVFNRRFGVDSTDLSSEPDQTGSGHRRFKDRAEIRRRRRDAETTGHVILISPASGFPLGAKDSRGFGI